MRSLYLPALLLQVLLSCLIVWVFYLFPALGFCLPISYLASKAPVPAPSPQQIDLSLRMASRGPLVSVTAVPTWTPGIEQENKLAQLAVTVFPAGRGSGTQRVSANDCVGRAREGDGDSILCLFLFCSCPGVTDF